MLMLRKKDFFSEYSDYFRQNVKLQLETSIYDIFEINQIVDFKKQSCCFEYFVYKNVAKNGIFLDKNSAILFTISEYFQHFCFLFTLFIQNSTKLSCFSICQSIFYIFHSFTGNLHLTVAQAFFQKNFPASFGELNFGRIILKNILKFSGSIMKFEHKKLAFSLFSLVTVTCTSGHLLTFMQHLVVDGSTKNAPN